MRITILTLFPGLFQSYVPARWGEVPTILFGLGAIGVARNPDGVVAQNARQLRQLLASLNRHRGTGAGEGAEATMPRDAEVGVKAEAAQ